MPICPKCKGMTTSGDVCQYCRAPFEKPAEPTTTNITIHNYGPPPPPAPTQNPATQQQPPAPDLPKESPKSWWATLVLCVLLGYVGIHRFFVGKIGTGIVWFFTLGCFGVGWVIDIVMVLQGKFKDKASLPILIPADITRDKKRTITIGAATAAAAVFCFVLAVGLSGGGK